MPLNSQGAHKEMGTAAPGDNELRFVRDHNQEGCGTHCNSSVSTPCQLRDPELLTVQKPWLPIFVHVFASDIDAHLHCQRSTPHHGRRA